jgi:hypothetical protein
MKIILIILLTITIYANTKLEMLKLYENKQYESACNIGFDNLKRNKNDEAFVSLYAFSCLKSDYINRLAVPITLLRFSPEARINSAYFSVILMQKKLLYHALLDGYEFSSLNLPTTNFILSKVFDLYTKEKNKQNNKIYLFKDKDDKNISYKLYLQKSKRLDKIIIEKYDNMKLIKRHTYW